MGIDGSNRLCVYMYVSEHLSLSRGMVNREAGCCVYVGVDCRFFILSLAFRVSDSLDCGPTYNHTQVLEH